jgi:hypothetical protein
METKQQIEAEVLLNAIDSLMEAMRADDMVTEAAHFRLSDSAWKEIRQMREKHTTKAFEAMKNVPSVGNETYWYLGCFPPLIKSDIPASGIHLCIHEVAKNSYNKYEGYIFNRPDPLPDITGSVWEPYIKPVSDERKREYEIRNNFADWLENTSDWLAWDAMP